MFGFLGRILRVDLTQGRLASEPIDEEGARALLGGTGLASKYLMAETPAQCDPLGPDNKLIIMAGPLTGTASPSSGRYSAVAKSPLTDLWAGANSGGKWGCDLRRAGYDGVILEGAARQPVALLLDEGEARLIDAGPLWGLGVTETTLALRATLGRRFNVACIGPAGENKVRYAAIMNDTHRALGRAGLGAVMGAKNLKAIAVAGSRRVPIAHPKLFRDAAKRASDLVNESLLKMTLEVYGTTMVLDLVNVKGGLPTRNWRSGSCAYADDINGTALNEQVLVGRKACYACPIACGRVSEVKSGKYACRGEGPEYETVGSLGAMCDVGDLSAITYAGLRCNDYGLDTISTGSTIAFAMECFELGLLGERDNAGRPLRFGDADAVIAAIDDIAHRRGLGDLLAEGTRRVSRAIGQGSERFAMQVKGLELAAYDCRATKITGLAFATANRGGDHITAYVQGPTFLDLPFLIVDESRIEDATVENPAEAKVVKDLEDALTVCDSVGCCKFMGMALMADDLLAVLNAATGWELSVEEMRRAGERAFNLARLFNVREGVGRADDTLPPRLLHEPLTDGPARGLVVDLDPLLDAYYAYRGWDIGSGHPLPATTRALGLDEIASRAGMAAQ